MALREADRVHRTIPRGGIADANGRRRGFGAHTAARGEVVGEARGEGRSTRRLNGEKPRHSIDQSERVCFTERLSERGGVPEVARGESDPVGRLPAELLEQLEHDGLLPLDAERVEGIDEVDPELLGRFARQLETVVEVA